MKDVCDIAIDPIGLHHLLWYRKAPLTLMPELFSAFFYGTLLHPSILRRVIGHDGEQLEICPALLLVSTIYSSWELADDYIDAYYHL